VRERERETMKEFDPPWTKLRGVKTDRAPSIIGKETGLTGSIRRETDEQNHEFYMKPDCIIYQQSLCGDILKFEHAMGVAVAVANVIQSHGHDHCHFQYFRRKLMFKMETPCAIQKSDG
jgi:hypothetical protein